MFRHAGFLRKVHPFSEVTRLFIPPNGKRPRKKEQAAGHRELSPKALGVPRRKRREDKSGQ